MGLPSALVFRTKGQLAIDICDGALAGGTRFDFICGDEVYGNCTGLREFLEGRGQGYVLRVQSNFYLTLARDVKVTCAEPACPGYRDRRWNAHCSAGPKSALTSCVFFRRGCGVMLAARFPYSVCR
jgi:hypothetical protein